MGNVLLDQYKRDDPVQIYEQWLEQNSDLAGKVVLSDNKLFRTSAFKYHNHQVLLKVFFKRDNTVLEGHLKSFSVFHSLIDELHCSHLLPLKLVEIRDYKDRQQQKLENNFVIAVRQYLHETLEQRVSRQPLCDEEQKKWFIYQMMICLETVHEEFHLYHGNIRTSNFLLTNYQYLVLTDFGAYKPTYILQDTEQGLAEFRLFYSSSVDRCNLAPEKMAGKHSISKAVNSKRVFSSEHEIHRKDSGVDEEDGQAQIQQLQAMDLYSLGLSILEVLNDGKPSLTYEQLLKISKQKGELTKKINDACSKLIEGGQVMAEILASFLSPKPDQRMPVRRSLQKYRSIIQSDVYSLYWHCLSAFTKVSFASSDLRVCLLHSLLEFIEKEIKQQVKPFGLSIPKCLQNFKTTKVFVELIAKKLIYVLPYEADSLLGKMVSHVAHLESDDAAQVESEDQIVMEDANERQQFFINPVKQRQIAKRLSFVSGVAVEKQLCPPKITPACVIKEGRNSERLRQLVEYYRKNQGLREEKIAGRRVFFRNSQLLIKTIWSCVRTCKFVSSRMLALEMMGLISREAPDQVLLKTMLPCLITATQDAELKVAKFALNCLIDLFYEFIDPFGKEEGLHYFEILVEFFINHIRQYKLRLFLFARFKQVYEICEWLEVHAKVVQGHFEQSKYSLERLVETLKNSYGAYTADETRCLMENIPEAILPDMFQFFVSHINTSKMEGLKASNFFAQHVSPLKYRNILDTFDSCVQAGLDEHGIALFYSIQYFTNRKCTSTQVLHKIVPHVINPHKWVRDEALLYLRMCVEQYPPCKNFFYLRDIFEEPFPLKPDDLEQQMLLPRPLKDFEVKLIQKKLGHNPRNITERLFQQYLKSMKTSKNISRKVEQQDWLLMTRAFREDKDKAWQLRSYVKRQIETLYQYNFFYYFWNLKSKSSALDREKGYPELVDAFKKTNRFLLDSASLIHKKKELFEYLLSIINSNSQKLLTKFASQFSSDKLCLAEAISLVGETLYKLQQFQIKPIVRLGDYVKKPTEFDRLPRPRGILVSEIYQHKNLITSLERVGDCMFLSGSNDGTLRLFNSKRIEQNVTTSSEACLDLSDLEKKTRITSISNFDCTFTAVVGTSRGQIKVFQLQRFPGNSRDSKRGNNAEMLRYSVAGSLEKVITVMNELQNECFAYITAEGILGLQDIRTKYKPFSCSLGKERGTPKALCVTNQQSLLVGTMDGYLLEYDIRCNIVSNVLQLYVDGQAVSITNITSCPLQGEDSNQLFALSYPSKNYEFSCFNLQDDRSKFGPERGYMSVGAQQILSAPYLVNRTNEQQFKLCSNNLLHRSYYDQLSDFTNNFSIFDYLSDPLTRKEAKIREVWMENSKHRYNQICSVYSKKTLPFLQFLPSGILTSLNPSVDKGAELKNKTALTLLTDRKEGINPQIQRSIVCKPNTYLTYEFSGDENSEYVTCCKVLSNFVVMGARNSVIKIFK